MGREHHYPKLLKFLYEATGGIWSHRRPLSPTLMITWGTGWHLLGKRAILKDTKVPILIQATFYKK